MPTSPHAIHVYYLDAIVGASSARPKFHKYCVKDKGARKAPLHTFYFIGVAII